MVNFVQHIFVHRIFALYGCFIKLAFGFGSNIVVMHFVVFRVDKHLWPLQVVPEYVEGIRPRCEVDFTVICFVLTYHRQSVNLSFYGCYFPAQLALGCV